MINLSLSLSLSLSSLTHQEYIALTHTNMLDSAYGICIYVNMMQMDICYFF